LGAFVRVLVEDGDRTDIGTGIAAPELAAAQLHTPGASVPRPVEVESTVSPTLGYDPLKIPFAGV
jgi:hypothetical protein